jgi:Domain of unknown function (DUF3127)
MEKVTHYILRTHMLVVLSLQVRQVRETADWQRQDFVLSDNGTKITIKLCNDKTELGKSIKVGETVEVSNVRTNYFNGQVTLDSTDETGLKVRILRSYNLSINCLYSTSLYTCYKLTVDSIKQ